MTISTPITSSRETIQAELVALDAKETTLREQLAALRADRSAREDAAARALLVGDDGGKAAAKLAALDQETAIINRALALLAERQTELNASLGMADLRDTVAEWVTVEREIAEREARVRELFAPIVAEEQLGYNFPLLDRGPLCALYTRREVLRRSAEHHAAGLGADLTALREEFAAGGDESGPRAV